MLFCFLRLHCVFIKSEYLDVGSGKYLLAANQPAIILIFKYLGVWCDGLSWLFVWLILRLIDEIVFRVCLLCFVLSVLLIEWLCGLFVVIDCSGWLFFVERLWFWEKGALIQTVDLLILVGIVCCENVFLFLTSFCERRMIIRLTNCDV